MRWTPIVLSCLWIVGCGSSADNTPVPHKYDDFAPAADPGSPSDDAGEPKDEADTGSTSPSESPDAAASPPSEEDTGASPAPETPDASAAPPPPVDSGKKPDGPSDAGAKADSSAPPDTSVAKPDSAVADTHVTKDSSTPKDTHVEDTFTPPEDTGAAVDSAPLPPADTGSAAVDTGTSKPDTGSGSASATLINHEITFYGWPDNDPPGPAIAYPDVHSSAGGTGTYADPITFATAPGEFANGTILYVPYIKKYVIMEDYCAQCTSDWSSGKRHIDIWMNSNASNTSKLQSCQYSWTRPSMPVEINPPPDREVTTAPLFDTSTAVCRTSP